MIKICKAGVPSTPRQYHSLDLRMLSAFLPSEITLTAFHVEISARSLQARLPPPRSLHADNLSDMPVRRDTGRTPFSAPLDRESCWQAAAERQSGVCPFEAQRTLKEQHKQIRVQQRGPSRNYWRCNVLLITIQSSPLFIVPSYGSSPAGFKKTPICCSIRTPVHTQWDSHKVKLITASPHK